MALEVVVQADLVVMEHPRLQSADRSVDRRLIVPLDLPHVLHVQVVVLDIPRATPIEEDELVHAKAVPEPPSEEDVVVADEVARPVEAVRREAGHLVDERSR